MPTESTGSTDTRTGAAPSPTGPLSQIDYTERIPNNVNLAGDRRLQRALEGWQPKFLDWWKELGPALPTKDVYLRTAIAVGRDGWAHFDHCLLYTSDAADDLLCVDLGGRRIIKK